MKKRKSKNSIHTQNPRRFPGFTVVVVTFFVKILDDFHGFVSECVSFQWKTNNPFSGVIVFRRKVTNFIGRETKARILPTKINEIEFAKVSTSTIITLTVHSYLLPTQRQQLLLTTWKSLLCPCPSGADCCR